MYNARRFNCDPTAYPRILRPNDCFRRVTSPGSNARDTLPGPIISRLSALFTPPRHKRGGFDFVTDKNKQVTHDR
ncbi:hypothetical protein F2A37_07680 [Pseudomonas chlororaphis]|nr:hypothetical protein F2A37_07680 [Pseudomonas chlororaphis]